MQKGGGMRNVLILLLITILGLVSMTGYLILSQKILAGEKKIAEGQLELENGEQMLAAGKARLANGKRQLSNAKSAYNKVNDIALLGIVSKLPITGAFFNVAHHQISEGQQLIAKGEAKVKNGEEQLAKGKLELEKGKIKMGAANNIRITFGIATAFFFVLAILLGIYWRKSLTNLLLQTLNKKS